MKKSAFKAKNKRPRMTEAEMNLRNPVGRENILNALKADLLAIRTAAELQVWNSAHAANLINELGRLFWIVDAAAQKCRLAGAPEMRVIAGAARALEDLAHRQQDIERHRPSLMSGLLAVERLWPHLNTYALGIASIEFDNKLTAMGLLRRIVNPTTTTTTTTEDTTA